MNQDLYNHNLVGEIVPPNLPTPWIRNPEWLVMPEVLPTERKIVILQRINPGISNFFGFTMTVVGGYTIDWGDGTSDTYNSAAASGKRYEFDSVPGTPTSEGYKQVLITITPVNPIAIPTVVDFKQKSALSTGNGAYSNGALDMIISIPGTTSGVTLGQNFVLTYNYPYLERVQLIASALTSYQNLFGDFVALQSASVASSATVTNITGMFWNCHVLSSAPTLPWSTVTTSTGVFERCYGLKYVGTDIITTPSTNIGTMFIYCHSLTTLPKIVLTAASVSAANMCTLCTKLAILPNIAWDKISSASSMFSQCYGLTTIGDLSLPICTNLSGMFNSCYGISSIGAINCPINTTLSSTFYYCQSVKKIGTITTGTALTTLQSAFNYCTALTTLPDITTTTNVNTLYSLAANCTSLLTPYTGDTANSTSMYSMYQYCDSLTYIPDYNYAKCQTVSYMFSNAAVVSSIGALDFNSAVGTVSLNAMCQGNNSFASSIISIGNITFGAGVTATDFSNACLNSRFLKTFNADCSKVNSTAQIANCFGGCGSLTSVILTGLRFGGLTIAASLSAPALIALFTSLGTAAGAQTLTVSGNWGWASLTAADKLIATSKGWTLA